MGEMGHRKQQHTQMMFSTMPALSVTTLTDNSWCLFVVICTDRTDHMTQPTSTQERFAVQTPYGYIQGLQLSAAVMC